MREVLDIDNYLASTHISSLTASFGARFAGAAPGISFSRASAFNEALLFASIILRYFITQLSNQTLLLEKLEK